VESKKRQDLGIDNTKWNVLFLWRLHEQSQIPSRAFTLTAYKRQLKRWKTVRKNEHSGPNVHRSTVGNALPKRVSTIVLLRMAQMVAIIEQCAKKSWSCLLHYIETMIFSMKQTKNRLNWEKHTIGTFTSPAIMRKTQSQTSGSDETFIQHRSLRIWRARHDWRADSAIRADDRNVKAAISFSNNKNKNNKTRNSQPHTAMTQYIADVARIFWIESLASNKPSHRRNTSSRHI